MSAEEVGQSQTKYVFKGRFGASPPTHDPNEEPSSEELDAFVKRILGVE